MHFTHLNYYKIIIYNYINVSSLDTFYIRLILAWLHQRLYYYILYPYKCCDVAIRSEFFNFFIVQTHYMWFSFGIYLPKLSSPLSITVFNSAYIFHLALVCIMLRSILMTKNCRTIQNCNKYIYIFTIIMYKNSR